MSISLKRTIVGTVAALAIGISAAGMTTPAFAQQQIQHPAHGGPVHGGPVHGGPAHGGPGHGNWHGGGGGGWGPAAVGLGVLGLAAGAAIAAQPDPGYYGDDGCQAYRPVYDAYGNYMGRRLVNVC